MSWLWSLAIARLMSSASFWEGLEYCAAAGVTIACGGEYLADFTSVGKTEYWKPRLGKWSTLLLIASLAIELTAAVTANNINDRTIADLGNRAQQAALLAGNLGVKVDKLPNFVAKKEREINDTTKGFETYAKQTLDRLTTTTASLTKARNDAEAAGKTAQEMLARIAAQNALRHLTKEQTRGLTKALLPFAGQKFVVQCNSGDQDGDQYARQIRAAIVAAHWDLTGPDNVQAMFVGAVVGVRVEVSKGDVDGGTVPVAARVLAAVFYRLHISDALGLYVSPTAARGRVEVDVGLKPRPDIPLVNTPYDPSAK